LMVTEIKVVAVDDDSLGIELPESVRGRFNLRLGDQLWLTDVPDGIELSPFSPEDSETMKAMRQVMREHREVLRKLADS
jgi:bifunctional DNA-binding transcriptional regulator/antitoxin component of YhaV-PrlF toxin-antitoxin module